MSSSLDAKRLERLGLLEEFTDDEAEEEEIRQQKNVVIPVSKPVTRVLEVKKKRNPSSLSLTPIKLLSFDTGICFLQNEYLKDFNKETEGKPELFKLQYLLQIYSAWSKNLSVRESDSLNEFIEKLDRLKKNDIRKFFEQVRQDKTILKKNPNFSSSSSQQQQSKIEEKEDVVNVQEEELKEKIRKNRELALQKRQAFLDRQQQQQPVKYVWNPSASLPAVSTQEPTQLVSTSTFCETLKLEDSQQQTKSQEEEYKLSEDQVGGLKVEEEEEELLGEINNNNTSKLVEQIRYHSQKNNEGDDDNEEEEEEEMDFDVKKIKDQIDLNTKQVEEEDLSLKEKINKNDKVQLQEKDLEIRTEEEENGIKRIKTDRDETQMLDIDEEEMML